MQRPAMLLKLFVDSEDDFLRQLYAQRVAAHNEKLFRNLGCPDAGFDLFCPEICMPIGSRPQASVDFKIKCSAVRVMATAATATASEKLTLMDDPNLFVSYFMAMRSSLVHTSLRLANAQGIIDAGYRGNLIGVFDLRENRGNYDLPEKYSRVLQICSPNLDPVFVQLVDSIEALSSPTERGEGGFGSTGTGAVADAVAVAENA